MNLGQMALITIEKKILFQITNKWIQIKIFFQNLCMSFTKSLEYSIFFIKFTDFLFYCKNWPL